MSGSVELAEASAERSVLKDGAEEPSSGSTPACGRQGRQAEQDPPLRPGSRKVDCLRISYKIVVQVDRCKERIEKTHGRSDTDC